MATAVQAGSTFGFQLIWAIVLGTVCIIFLVEMAGRFAAVSRDSIVDAIRERFGFNAFLWPLLATLIINLMVMSAEIGGVSIAAELAMGIGFQWWALPAAFLAWLFLWKGTFGFIEKGVAILGLVTLCFVVAAVILKPDWTQLAAGALPKHDAANY